MAEHIDPIDPTDPELVERAAGGDEEAFGALILRHQRKIYRVALAIVRDPMEADTVTQDTFVKAWYALSGFEGRSEIETWLTRIAINLSRDALRRRKRWVAIGSRSEEDNVVLLERPDERPDAERTAISTQLSAALTRAVDGLSTQQKTIFCLRHYESLSLEEIATMLDLKAGTVRAHLFRAVHKVRNELKEFRDDTVPHPGVRS